MKNFIKLLLVLFPVMVIGQTTTQNYIKTVTYKTAVTQKITTPTAAQASQNVTYFDGLGRPIQQIAVQQSDSGKDIVTPIEYDDFGRQVKEYLPFASAQTTSTYINPTTLVSDLTAQYKTNYGTVNANPYSVKQLEASPLNRVLKQAAPGNDWSLGLGHEIKMDYQTNVDNEVRLFTATAAWDPTLGLYTISFSNTGTYAAGQLYKTVTYDENTAAPLSELNGSTVEFKNKEGQVVLKRTYGTVGTGTTNEKHDTYYVYDVYGNLTYVIPPKAVDLIGTATCLQADVTSTAVVASGVSLALTASNSIRLLPGFNAKAGSTFSAVIDNGNQTILDNLCYQYKYDYRNRLVEKKLPGKQWEFIVYDKLDRPVATGPANSPFSDITTTGWSVTKYDAFNRPVITGWLSATVTAVTRKTLQDAQNALTSNFNETKIATATNTIVPATTGVKFRYDSAAWPTSGYHVMSVNYYDDYNFPDAPATIPATVAANTAGVSQVVYYNTTTKPIGLATGSWVRVPDLSTNYKYEQTYSLYDEKARLVRSYTQNFLGGFTCLDNKLDTFSGQLQYTITTHSRLSTDPVLKTTDTFTYSAQDRLKTHTHQIGTGTPEVIASNSYDELGQLISKKVGGNTQNINYTYNIRGWMTGINDVTGLTIAGDPKDLFAFKINYNNTPGITGGKALYNGNIAETFWISTSETTPVIRGYAYLYDNLNRLRTSFYKRDATVSNAYSENLTYDKNGNIGSINRNGNSETATQIDALVYTYTNNNTTNQLLKVVDNAPAATKIYGFADSAANTDDYSYDANGNMTKDNNKNITAITYNHLNLPTKITFATTGNIVYIYNAAGQKVQKIVTETGKAPITTDYLGGYQYVSALPKFFPTAEGYVEVSGSSYKYVYQYKDHLGNIRLSYDKNLAIQDENQYYPFGLQQKRPTDVIVASNYKYKYNGKELQDELGLNMYDYGARNYMADIGRWGSIDGKAEKYLSLSPYHYAGNNPVLYLDLDGNEFTESAWKWVNRLIADINSRQASNNKTIEEAKQTIASGKFGWFQSEKSLNNKIARLNNENAGLETTRGETATLAASSQVYDVVENSGNTERDALGNTTTVNQTTFNSDNNRVQLTVSSGTDLGLFSHELKHMYQFETGETTLGLTKNNGGISLIGNNLLFYDLSDEVQAYQRGALFGQRENINSTSDVLTKGIYSDKIPTGPINAVNHPNAAGIKQDPQSFANKYNAAFRIGTTTYKPQ